MVAFAFGFPEEAVFVFIPYSCSIKLTLKPLPGNYPYLSYVISTGHGYQTRHLVSTKLIIVIDFLLLYCVILNHLVIVYIIVMDFNIIVSLPFIRIL